MSFMARNVKAAALETRHDLADQAARDAVGLDHDERSLHSTSRGGDRPRLS